MKVDGPIQWTASSAQREFGLNRETIQTRLDQAGQKPDEAGCYTTQQILASMFTDAKQERARLTREQADKLALENAQTRQELVRIEEVERVWAEWFIGVRNAVKEQDVPMDAKQSILEAMREVNPEDYFKGDPVYEPSESSDQA